MTEPWLDQALMDSAYRNVGRMIFNQIKIKGILWLENKSSKKSRYVDQSYPMVENFHAKVDENIAKYFFIHLGRFIMKVHSVQPF